MMFLLSPMSRAARNRPGRVLIALAALTAVLAGFAANQSTDADLAAFAPDSELNDALLRVEDDFTGGGEVVQVIVDAGADGSVVNADGIRIAEQIADAAADSGADLAVNTDGEPAVVTYADGARLALAADGIDPDEATDEQLDAATAMMFEGDAVRLLSMDADADSSTARGGLAMVYLDAELDEAGEEEASLLVADAIEGLGANGVDVHPFNQWTMNDSLQAESEDEMNILLGISLLLIVGILFFIYRSVSDVLMGFAGLIVSILWMTGFAVILGPDFLGITGPFSQIAMIVPILLVGLGIDYAIHLTSRYREELRHGATPPAGAAMAIRTVGGALVLATITTVVGFLTNLVSPLPPIGDFGLFTAFGVISAFIVMTMMVPAMRNLLDQRRAKRGKAPAGMRAANKAKRSDGPGSLATAVGKVAVLAKRAPKATLAVAGVITVAAAASATQIETSFSQDEFIPGDSEIAQIIDTIDEMFGGDLEERTFVLLDGDLTSPEAVAAMNETANAIGGLDDVRPAGDGSSVSTPVSMLGELAAAVPEFGEAAAPLGLEAGGGLTPDADVAGLYELAHEVAPEQAAQLVTADGEAGILDIPTTAGQDRAQELSELVESELGPLQDASISTMVTSEPLVFDDILDALAASQSRGIVITLIAAMLLLCAFFAYSDRRPALGVITMIPSIAVVAWVLGLMPVLGISFNVLTATVASLGIGIGVPYGIHVTHRFLEDRRRAETVGEAIEATVTHTGGAMAGSAATTAAGFGVLVFASLPPIRQFGGIIAITILFSLLAAVAIQPSCLKLWADRRVRKGDTGELLAHERRELQAAQEAANAAAIDDIEPATDDIEPATDATASDTADGDDDRADAAIGSDGTASRGGPSA